MANETIFLQRTSTSDKGTFGVLMRGDRRIAVTCELPWRDNHNKTSCIPKGVYRVTLFKSPEKNPQVDHMVYLLHGTEPRENVEIHIGNTIKDILGCILVGTEFGFIAGLPAVINSTVAMKALLAELPKEFNLEISGVV